MICRDCLSRITTIQHPADAYQAVTSCIYGFCERINLWVIRRYPMTNGDGRCAFSRADVACTRATRVRKKQKYSLSTSWKLVSWNSLRTNQCAFYLIFLAFCHVWNFSEKSHSKRVKTVPIDNENITAWNRVPKKYETLHEFKIQ